MKFYHPTEIKEVANIIEVATELLELEVKSNKCHCFNPEMHADGDATPSMTFNIDKNIFKCWVCDGIGGSVIDLVMQYHQCSYADAQLMLGEFYNLRVHSFREPTSKEKNITKKKIIRREPTIRSSVDNKIPDYVPDILENFLDLCPICDYGMAYLNIRGISKRVCKAARLSFCSNFRYIYDVLLRMYGKDKLKAAGLTAFYVYGIHNLEFIIFPYTKEGRVYYLKARTLLSKEEITKIEKRKDEHIGRFKNSKGSVPFPYLIDKLNPRMEDVYIVEGELKALAMSQHKYQAVGIPGVNSFNKQWVNYFSPQHKIKLIMDNDEAGRKAVGKLKEIFLLGRGIEVEDLTPYFDCDIDEYLIKEKK